MPFPEFADRFRRVTMTCAGVRTMTAELALAGRAGGRRLRGRAIAGFERPASMRLEGVAPFGPPAFILAARAGTATLLLPRDNRVLRKAAPEDILGALTGVALSPADLQAILTGCVSAEPISIEHELLYGENPLIQQSEDHDSGWGMAVYRRADSEQPELVRFPAIEGKTWNHPVLAANISNSRPERISGIDSQTKAIVIDPAYTWGRDRRPRTPWSETIIYEAHVRGLTMQREDIPLALRGSFAALSHPAMIRHLLELGVSAIELLPIHAFVDDRALVGRNLSNFWGYNSIGFFAPHNEYSSSGQRGEQVREFKAMVKALHAVGIEVILDVVYNHSAEGNHLGPTMSLKGIDNPTYYRLVADNPRYYFDYTGTGNTLHKPAANFYRVARTPEEAVEQEQVLEEDRRLAPRSALVHARAAVLDRERLLDCARIAREVELNG